MALFANSCPIIEIKLGGHCVKNGALIEKTTATESCNYTVHFAPYTNQ